jgi:hypothetical protein
MHSNMLTDIAIKALKPGKKTRKVYDGHGLHVCVLPNGGKYWRWRYRYAGLEKLISFGAYPEVSLKAAREKRLEARRLLDRYIDPSAKRKAEKAAIRNEGKMNKLAAIPWQPIDTAPMSRVVLAYSDHDGVNTDLSYWFAIKSSETGLWYLLDDAEAETDLTFTHWAELTPPGDAK